MISSSAVTIVKSCSFAWQINIRSKGSQWNEGNSGKCLTLFSSRERLEKRCFSRNSTRSISGFAGRGSLPRECLIMASHNETTLTNTPVFRIKDFIFKNLGQFSVSRNIPKKNVCVEKESHFPSKSLRISSGSGSLKSSGTTN